MNGELFLAELQNHLAGRMPPDEIARTLAYYAEYFQEAGQEGEAAVLADLGSPAALAYKLIGEPQVRDYAPPKPRYQSRARQRRSAILAGVLLLCGLGAALFTMRMVWVNRVSYSHSYSVEIPAASEATVPVPDIAISADRSLVPDETVPLSGLLQDLDVSLETVGLVVETGDRLSLRMTGAGRGVSYNYDGGALHLYEQTGESLAAESDRTVVLTVPAGSHVAALSLHNAMGPVSLSGLSCGSLNLSGDLGQVALTDLTAGYLSVYLTAGSLNAERVVADDANFNGEFGAVSLTDCILTNLSVSLSGGSLHLDGGTLGNSYLSTNLGEITARGITAFGLSVQSTGGNVTLDGTLWGLTEVYQTIGRVSVSPALPAGEYDYTLSTGLGVVTVDGAPRGNFAMRNGDGTNEIVVNSNTGYIDLNFAG